MISNVYSYYATQYGRKINSRYDSHTSSQLKNIYSKVIKINSQAPTYKVDTSEDAQRYAIDLKENARELAGIAYELSDSTDGSITYKKVALSSNPAAVDAAFIGDSSVQDDVTFDVKVSQLASNQINTGNFLQPNSRLLEPGEYSFDLNINNLTYAFEFEIDSSESTADVQHKISRLINRSDIGISADVLTDSLGNTALSISSVTTGLTNGIRPVIFLIKANEDPAGAYGTNETAIKNSTSLTEALGLNRVTQYPSNAVFTINDEEKTSTSNDVTINHQFALTFNGTTDKPVTIQLQTDSNSIVDSITDLVSGFNQLVSISSDNRNDQFTGNAKLRKEFSNMLRSFGYQLNTTGLEVTENGSINVNKEAILSASENGTLNDVFSNLNSFKTAIQDKAEDIAYNPMNYVNNKIVAYKNPIRPMIDPYNLSAYTGMMFNGYC